MKKQIKQLKEFHKAFNLPMRDKPEIISLDEFRCRHNLIHEEIDELAKAHNEGDLIEVADAIIDSLYVLIGTAVQFGLADKLPQMFDEVHRSNMSKLDVNGNPIFRADGKVMKSELFSPPRLSQILTSLK